MKTTMLVEKLIYSAPYYVKSRDPDEDHLVMPNRELNITKALFEVCKEHMGFKPYHHSLRNVINETGEKREEEKSCKHKGKLRTYVDRWTELKHDIYLDVFLVEV